MSRSGQALSDKNKTHGVDGIDGIDGIILGLRNFGDSHRILEILTADQGKMTIVARGARASKRRFAGALDLFVSNRFYVRHGRGMPVLDSVDIQNARVGIRNDLESLQRASLLVESTSLLSAENAHEPELYRALIAGLDALDQGALREAARSWAYLLQGAGIMPDFSVCNRCGRSNLPLGFISEGLGTIVCKQCVSQSMPLTKEALSLFLGPDEPSQTLNPLSVDAAEAIALLIIELHTGRQLKSRGLFKMSPVVNSMHDPSNDFTTKTGIL
ncbi:DNA repair protein RecO [Myxococcota bacterium]|nr:DNA repair protein RecO [Myxococcota bacterium]